MWPDIWSGEPAAVNLVTAQVGNIIADIMELPDCRYCEPEKIPDRATVEEWARAYGIGGAIIEEEEEMGQVVTDVQVFSDGVLRVYFGPCCWKDVYVTNAGGGGGSGWRDEEPYQELPEDVRPTEFSQCGMANAAVDFLMGVGRDIWDMGSDANVFQWKSYLNAKWSGVSWDWLAVVNAVLQRGIIEIVDITPEWLPYLDSLLWDKNAVFDDDLVQRVKARFVRYMPTDGSRPSNDAMKELIGCVQAVYPLFVANFFIHVIRAIGYGDLADVALLGALDFTADCSDVAYPAAPVYLPGLNTSALDWLYVVDLTTSTYGIEISPDNTWVAGEGVQGAASRPTVTLQLVGGNIRVKYVYMKYCCCARSRRTSGHWSIRPAG